MGYLHKFSSSVFYYFGIFICIFFFMKIIYDIKLYKNLKENDKKLVFCKHRLYNLYI